MLRERTFSSTPRGRGGVKKRVPAAVSRAARGFILLYYFIIIIFRRTTTKHALNLFVHPCFFFIFLLVAIMQSNGRDDMCAGCVRHQNRKCQRGPRCGGDVVWEGWHARFGLEE